MKLSFLMVVVASIATHDVPAVTGAIACTVASLIGWVSWSFYRVLNDKMTWRQMLSACPISALVGFSVFAFYKLADFNQMLALVLIVGTMAPAAVQWAQDKIKSLSDK